MHCSVCVCVCVWGRFVVMICLKKGGEFEEDGPLCLGGKRHSSATLGSFFSLSLSLPFLIF